MKKSEIERILRQPYAIELEYGDSDDGVLARVAEWPGCITAGATRDEALARISDAMRDWVEMRASTGLPVPEPLRGRGGTVVVRMSRSLHRDAEQRARNEGVSLNQWMVTTAARALGGSQPSATPSAIAAEPVESQGKVGEIYVQRAHVTVGPVQGRRRVGAAAAGVTFLVDPEVGSGNVRMTLTAVTDAHGFAEVSFSRAKPGTDRITVFVSALPGLRAVAVRQWSAGVSTKRAIRAADAAARPRRQRQRAA